MICPDCDSKLSITDSRQWEPQLRVRTYLCKKCGFRDRSFDRLEVKSTPATFRKNIVETIPLTMNFRK